MPGRELAVVRGCLLSARTELLKADEVERRQELKRILMQAAFWVERGLAADECYPMREHLPAEAMHRRD
jgi:hypothetical protein